MKTIPIHYILSSILIFCFHIHFLKSQTFLFEDFENGGVIPDGWLQEDVGPSNGGEWTFQNGGFVPPPPAPPQAHPPTAHSGEYNALYFYPDVTPYKSILITPAINLSTAVDPALRFWHAQYDDDGFLDELRVYYKTHADSAWVLLQEYLNEVYNTANPSKPYVLQNIELPNPSSTYYIGFEGTTRFGAGICIDEVSVVETAIIPKHVESITVSQASTDFVYNGIVNAKILKINIHVFGNSGSLPFNSITFHAENTNMTNIKENGARLYSTQTIDRFFIDHQLGSDESFNGDSVVFDNLNYELDNGDNYFWLAFDISDSAQYNQSIDAKILTHRINISDTLYPQNNANPIGNRPIYFAAYSDDFESDKGWLFHGEFQRDTAQGKGGVYFGFTDPEYTYNGQYMIGTDISGNGTQIGDYEKGIPNRYDSAVSPTINLFHYRSPYLRFYRQLNIDYLDHAYIDVSKDAGKTWVKIWESENSIFTTDNDWNLQQYDLSNLLNRDSLIKIRFGLGATDSSRQFSGWNIDNFVITANPIDYDVAPIECLSPTTNCGNSLVPVTVKLKNLGRLDLTEPIPLAYAIDENLNFVFDTLYGGIPFEDSVLFTFSQLANVSTPDFYDNFVIRTWLSTDDDVSNDDLVHTFFSIPTYTLPYYQNFEATQDFWLPYGINSSWEYGQVQGDVINHAASGINCIATNLDTTYNDNEVSYMESPCFNLSTIDFSMIEFKLWYETQTGIDGLCVLYSTNGRTVWDTIGLKNDELNWYNSDAIVSLNNAIGNGSGWTGSSGNWIDVAHFLPTDIARQSSVKLRFTFANADTINNYDGVAIDDIIIRETPPDVGITEILVPDSACELSHQQTMTLVLHNFGLDTLEAGSIIPISVEINNELQFTENMVLTTNLLHNDSIHLTLQNTVDVWDEGTYNLKVWSQLSGDENMFSSGINYDTAYKSIAVYGMPNYTLGETIISSQPDTIVLDAGTGYTNYLWNNGISGQFFDVDTAGYYWVTVTNAMGCNASDTIRIVFSLTDIAVNDLININTSCSNGNAVYPQLEINNFGLDTLINDTVIMGYKCNTLPWVMDTLIINESVFPDSLFILSFTNSIDLSAPGIYNFEYFAKMLFDVNTNNDTLTKSIETYGSPIIDIGYDTIITSQPDTILLDAGIGFNSYLWQDSSTLQTFDVINLNSAWYSVNVTDSNGCEASDSCFIYANDLALLQISEPVSQCQLGNQQNIAFVLQNNGPDTLKFGTVYPFGFKINGEPIVTDYISLSSDILPSNSLELTSNIGLAMGTNGLYNITAINLLRDYDTDNDTATSLVENYIDPIVNIGPDTIFTDSPDTILLDAGSGFMLYQWQDGSGSQMYDVDDYGLYWVMVTDYNTCTAYDSTIVVIDDFVKNIYNKNIQLAVYPNPVKDYLHIAYSSLKASEILLKISDEKANTIYSQTLIMAEQGYLQIDFTQYASGIYYLHFVNKEISETFEIIKP